MMSMVEAYKRFWQNYAKFSERARRSEYWWVVLVQSLISVVFSLLRLVAGDSVMAMVFQMLAAIYGLASLVPMISLTVRRLHDIDKSGWWYLINFVPCIGGIVMLVFCCMDGTAGSNRFGDDPKAMNVVY